MKLPFPTWIALVILALVACSAQTPAGRAGQTAEATPARAKTLTVVLPLEIAGLATDAGVFGALSRPTGFAQAFVNNYVTVRDDEDRISPQIAVELPSLDTGSWKVLDDGRMEVTWRLRPGVRWHDGVEFTSADIAFGWQVASDPATPVTGSSSIAHLIAAVDTPDPHEVILHWRQASLDGGELARGQLHPLPRHVLGTAFSAEKESFVRHPYFTEPTAFVGNGAYRAVLWERGSHLNAEAFDGYFLGRAKIDRVTFRFIPDPHTAMANLLGGQADILYTAVGLEEAKVLQAQWEQAGAGVVQMSPTNYRHILPQMRLDQANPRDLVDVRMRKALMYALDRDQLADGVYPGANLAADGIGWPGTPVGDAVGRGVVRYPYEPGRAGALLEQLGWRRSGDGGFTRPNGERLQLELRAQGIAEIDTAFALMQQSYSRAGIELLLHNLPGTRNPSDYSLYPGLLMTGFPINHPRFAGRWQTKQIATVENRYSGFNTSGYSNPELDLVLDRFGRALRIEDQLREWEAAWRILTDDVAVMSLYYYVQPNAYRKGVLGAMPRIALGSGTWKVHTWDVV